MSADASGPDFSEHCQWEPRTSAQVALLLYVVLFGSIFPANKNSGSDESCSTTEKTIKAGMDLPYKTPISQLPKNQAIPKPESNRPKAVLRLSAGMTGTRIALSSESCAPKPMPHSSMPASASHVCSKKTSGAKNAD